MIEKQSPAVADTTKPGQQSSRAGSVPAPKSQCKWRRVLQAFVGGGSWNRFEAERALGDHCLHSTVAKLQALGLLIDRQLEVVQGRFGAAHVKRYKLNNTPENVKFALALLYGTAKNRCDAKHQEVSAEL